MTDHLKTIATALGIIMVLGGLIVNGLFTYWSMNAHIEASDEFHKAQIKFNEAQVELNTAMRVEREVQRRMQEKEKK